LRVLQVSDGYRPAVGGLERLVESLSKALVEQGIPTTVATLSRPDTASVEEVDGVEIRRLDGYTRHLQRFAADPGHYFHPTCPDPQLVARLNDLVAEFRPDVVHAHGWMLNSCLSLRLPAHTALVTTLHDYGLVCAKKTMIPLDQPELLCQGPAPRRCVSCAGNYYGRAKGTALALGLWESRRRLHRVSMFLPVSGVVASASLTGIPPEKICVIPSFVEDRIFAAARETPRPSFLPAGDFILFVGALGEHKGVDLLIDAHRRMRTALPLVLLGSARADTGDWQVTGDRPVIVRTGVPHDEIMACFAAATVAVAPSRWEEPLGLTPIEAMAAGTPVVVTRVGALPEVVAHERTGLVVPPGDPQALRSALERIVENPSLQRQYGSAGMERARLYTASAIMPRIMAAYRTACPTDAVGV
jgi:glycosyltransferase involved in cell wall biosynthesis